MQAPRPYLLTETNWKTVHSAGYQVAVLPWGATEAHNYHLPYGTDNLQNEHVVSEAARVAWERGARVIVLPNVPFGINTGQLDVPLCLNMMPSTQYALLRDLADVVLRAGIRKLLILNGHGGNNFKNMIRELSAELPRLFVCAADWYKAARWEAHFSDLGDHAGELETSTMLHIAPQWVLPLAEAGKGHAKQYKMKALREGWATAQRQWTQVSADTGVGNPALATPEKGAAFLRACTERLADFLAELSDADPDHLYA
jgi:creatinine amidohydrolase